MPAPITGENGDFQIGGTPVSVQLIGSWELSPSRKMLNSVVFGEDWEDNAPSVGSWTLKASGFWTAGDTTGQSALITAFLNRTSVSVTLPIDGTHKWTGTMFVKEIPQKVQVDALVTQDFTFQGTGAPAYS